MRTARAAFAVLLLAGCGAGSAPRLRVASEFQTLTIEHAYAGTSYHVALGDIEPLTGDAVTFRDIGFAESDGVTGTAGWLTSLADPKAIRIGSEIGDLVRRVPENTFTPLPGARIQRGDGEKWYLIASVVPARTGTVTARDVVVRYRDAGGHDGTLHVDFALTIEVEATGVDPRATQSPSAG